MISLITLTIILRLYESQQILRPARTIHESQQIISSAVYQDKTTYSANDNALNFLTTSPGPYKIISVVGQARKGKSTTLNSIVSALINHTISPFNTSNGMDPCTVGMWMYVVPKCSRNVNEDKCEKSTDTADTYCVNSDYSFMFLDIQGSDTAQNEMTLRYASIVTLLSSKIFLFIHETLYAHDIDHINDIETFRKTMSSQNIHIPFDEIDLGIIIREPLGGLIKGKLEEKINELFHEFSGINLNRDSVLLSRKLPVLAVNNFENRKKYKKSIQKLAAFVFDETNYQKSTNRVKFGLLSAEKIIEFIHIMIRAMNENEDLNAICIGCLFSKIIDWNEWSEWSECSETCGGGITERKRTCNTRRDKDCSKYRHGSAIHQQPCNEFDCELLKWDEWHPWSKCDNKCGGGIQERFRECKTGDSKHCEKEFGDTKTGIRDCNTHSCANLFCTHLGIFC